MPVSRLDDLQNASVGETQWASVNKPTMMVSPSQKSMPSPSAATSPSYKGGGGANGYGSSPTTTGAPQQQQYQYAGSANGGRSPLNRGMSPQRAAVAGGSSSSSSNNIQLQQQQQQHQYPRNVQTLTSPQMDHTTQAFQSLGPELEPIHAKLDSLKTHTLRLEDLQLQYLAEGEKRTQKKIENTINCINKDALAVKALIGTFEQNTQQLIQASGGLLQQNIIDMRNNEIGHCGKKLVEYTKGAWDMQKEHEKKRTNQAARRLKVRFANDTTCGGRDGKGEAGISDEDAQRIAAQLVQTGNDDQLFLLARDELEKAMATRDAVLEIERSMRELYQMFCDLNVLVVEQGKGVDEVGKMVHKASKNMEKGNKELKAAKRHQKACVIM